MNCTCDLDLYAGVHQENCPITQAARHRLAQPNEQVTQIAVVLKDLIESLMLWNGQASAGLDVKALAGLRDELHPICDNDWDDRFHKAALDYRTSQDPLDTQRAWLVLRALVQEKR